MRSIGLYTTGVHNPAEKSRDTGDEVHRLLAISKVKRKSVRGL